MSDNRPETRASAFLPQSTPASEQRAPRATAAATSDVEMQAQQVADWI